MQEGPNEKARKFYEEAALGAASVGACIDLYVVTPLSSGLEMMEPLVGHTGGVMYLYSTTEDAALPQVGKTFVCASQQQRSHITPKNHPACSARAWSCCNLLPGSQSLA